MAQVDLETDLDRICLPSDHAQGGTAPTCARANATEEANKCGRRASMFRQSCKTATAVPIQVRL